MAAKGYTTKTAVENYMLITIDAAFDTQIDEWIEGAEKFMDGLADRQLVADSAAGDFKYDGNGKKSLMIDDFIEITKIQDKTLDITAACFLYPANKNPKWRIESEQSFTQGLQNITVTGKRGYSALADLPKDLKFAATVIVAGIVNHYTVTDKDIRSESIGRYTVTYKDKNQTADYDRALGIINSYKRIR